MPQDQSDAPRLISPPAIPADDLRRVEAAEPQIIVSPAPESPYLSERILDLEPFDIDAIRRICAHAPIDLVALVQALGMTYDEPIPALAFNHSSRLLDYGDSAAIQRHYRRFAVTVNPAQNLKLRRFITAHQIGHYVLHRDLLMHERHVDSFLRPPATSEGPITREHEREANRIALYLLMPAGHVRDFVERGMGIAEIAERLDVPATAVKLRLDHLGLAPLPN